ncbi:MAG: hypothetical protein ACYTG4_07675 [Planctomycetota bacterium]
MGEEAARQGGFRCFRAETFILPILIGLCIGLGFSYFGSTHDPGNAADDAARLLDAERVVFVRELAPPDTGVLEYELDPAEREALANMMRSIEGDHWPCDNTWAENRRRIVVDGVAGEWGNFTNRAEIALDRVHPEIPAAAIILRAIEQFRVWDGAEDAAERASSTKEVFRSVAEQLQLPGKELLGSAPPEAEVRKLVEFVENGDDVLAWEDLVNGFKIGAADKPLFARFTVTNAPEIRMEGPPKPSHE